MSPNELSLAVKTRNYRSLRNAEWAPSGVCALVGPNGSGKTTLLLLLEFFRDAYSRNVASAADAIGGIYGLRTWGVDRGESVQIALKLGDLHWAIDLITQDATLAPHLGEVVSQDGRCVISRQAGHAAATYNAVRITVGETDDRTALRVVNDLSSGSELESLVRFITNIRVYRAPNVAQLQANGSRHGSDLYLHPSGQNIFSVLRNWRDRRDLKPAYQFVVNHLQKAFPEVFADLDFHVAGMTVTADVIDPTSNEPCPLAIAPDGLITGLLHLTAAAGAVPGSLIAIDDFGNDLHPYAIRKIVEAFRELADEKGLTICLASHSPVLLDEFKDEPGSVWVMEHGLENRPVRLTDLFDEDWLSRFSLGRLYSHGEFGGQIKRTDAAR